MAASKALYYGPGNRGAATILGTEGPNLFEVMDQIQGREDANEKIKREESKARGKQLNELLEFQRSKTNRITLINELILFYSFCLLRFKFFLINECKSFCFFRIKSMNLINLVNLILLLLSN